MCRYDRERMGREVAQAVLDRLCTNDLMDHAPQGRLVRTLARTILAAEARYQRRAFNRKPSAAGRPRRGRPAAGGKPPGEAA